VDGVSAPLATMMSMDMSDDPSNAGRGFSWVSGPYETCPGCGAEAFGRLWVHSRSYARKCDRCGHRESFELPELRKKVIYLDQFALIGMLKALHPDAQKIPEAEAERWRAMFEMLHRLTRLQLVVCPESRAHEVESVLHARHFDALRRLYELFAHGAEIQDPEQVTGRQVVQHARDWIAGNITEPLALREEDALTGDPHGWKDAYILSVHYPIPEEEVEESRRRREQGGTSLEDIFRRWQKEGSREFDDWYREELDGWATYTWTDFLRSAGRFLAAVKGVREFDLEDLWPGTRSRELVLTLARIFQEGGVPEDEAFDRVHDFLFSATLGRVPKLRIQSLLWAGMAHQAARGGRQRPPGRGAMSDVGTIATALPYCDAMLIDKEMRGLLELGPVRERLGFETKVFSPQTLDAFVEYLALVEQSGPQNVTQLARSIYGEPEPYLTIFNDPDLRLDPSAR
jgi:hypothetical protein